MGTSKQKIHIAAILGSVRPDNMTAKVLDVVADEIRLHPGVSLDIIDPKDYQLFNPGEENNAAVASLQKAIHQATGVIMATPEYHGSYSSTIKLMIDNLGYPSVLAGKPVALLGVASGQVGAIKALEHLRSVCSHVGAIVLPGSVSVAGVHKLFDENGQFREPKAEQKIRALAGNLLNYILKHVCPGKTLEDAAREE